MFHSIKTGSLKASKSAALIILALLFALGFSTQAQTIAPKESAAALREN
jgi:hypothetical protein